MKFLSVATRGCSIVGGVGVLLAAGCSSSSSDAPLDTAAAGSLAGGGGTSAAASANNANGGAPVVAGAASDIARASNAGSAGTAASPSGGTANSIAGAAGVGSSAGAPSGGQAGSPPTTACANGAVFCDDFEGQPENAASAGQWAARSSGAATVTVDTLHAHSGTKAIHFHSASVNNNQRAYIITQNAPGFPIESDVAYVRFMLYIGRYMQPPGTTAHNRIAWLGGRQILEQGGGAGPGYILSTYNGIAIERLEKNQGFQRDTSQHMEEASRVGKWQCFEFAIDNKGGVPPGEKSDSTTTARIWQNDVALKLSAGGSVESWLAAPFEALQFSLWSPQTDPEATDYWIDDVVVSTQRINCPAP